MDSSISKLLFKRNYWVRAILAIILGTCLLFWPDFALMFIVKIVAAFLLGAGLITFIVTLNLRSRTGGVSAWSAINISASIILGLLILIFPEFFISFIILLFGAILIFVGIIQLSILFGFTKHAPVSVVLYIIPILLCFCGLLFFFKPNLSISLITMIFGGSILLYGISEIIMRIELTRENKAL